MTSPRTFGRALRRLLRSLHARFALGPSVRIATWWRVGRHHVAPIAPLRTIDLDPATVDRWIDMESADYRRIRYRFSAEPGDWDLATVPLAEHFVYTSLEARFTSSAAWSDTPLYEVAMDGVRDGSGRYHGCRTVDDVERRLQRLERLFERIARDGYASQARLRSEAEHHGSAGRMDPRPAALGEVVVHVDREGRFVLVDGVHRFSIARLTGVPRIPALVLLRHATWQAMRDAVARGHGDLVAAKEHPDLRDLVS